MNRYTFARTKGVQFRGHPLHQSMIFRKITNAQAQDLAVRLGFERGSFEIGKDCFQLTLSTWGGVSLLNALPGGLAVFLQQRVRPIRSGVADSH
ncbi:hypothetical protein [Larkinella soli]|uniref:hypothetical protein n=1 Tax=Larkinella soli TaxID=1770527 RepID=UPI000FFB6394|nr:hypothetical protein [Larkinella soli]